VRDIAKYDPQTDTTTVVNRIVYDTIVHDTIDKVTSTPEPPALAGGGFGHRNPEPPALAGGALASLFLFTARAFDPDIGLQNNLHRWYAPAVGRWLSEDPIGFTGGDGNLHRYAANRAVLYIDPNGLETCCAQAERCLLGLLRDVAAVGVQLAHAVRRLDAIHGSVDLARRVYAAANEQNANASLWSLLWGGCRCQANNGYLRGSTRHPFRQRPGNQ